MSWTRVCFRYVGDAVDVERVSFTLGLPRAITYRRGDNPKSRAPNSWILESNLSEYDELETHIWWLLDELLPLKNDILQLNAEFGNPSFFCTIGNDGEDEATHVANFRPETIATIASLQASLLLSFSG